MSNLKVIGPREEFGSVFPAYADLARACVPIGLLDHDEAFVEVAMKMVRKCYQKQLPVSLLNAFESYQAYKRDHDETQLDLAAAIRGSERDIFLYHLYGLMTYRQIDMEGQKYESTVTRQRKNWIKLRAYLDAQSMGLEWPDDENSTLMRRLMREYPEAAASIDEPEVLLHDAAPVGFPTENPGILDLFFKDQKMTALLGFVHGRPFYFLNTPYRSTTVKDSTLFQRDEITVIHGFERVEIIHPSLPDSPTGELVEHGDQQFYVCVPSQHKTSHISNHDLPKNSRTRNPTAFLTEIMAPKIRDEYGRLLPEAFHKEGIERCMEGDFDFHTLDLSATNARALREESAKKAKQEFYADEDVGMF